MHFETEDLSFFIISGIPFIIGTGLFAASLPVFVILVALILLKDQIKEYF